jgi:capsular polysaccharide biosynthesis protein
MEIREYLAILRRRAWIPAVLVVVTVAATAVFVFTAKPEYQATATVIASGSGSTGLNFQDVASSNNVALKVREKLQLPQSIGDITGRIQVTSGRTNLYRITATDPDPRRAEAIANTTAQIAADLYEQLAGGTNNSVSQDLQGSQAAARDQYLLVAKKLLDFMRANPQGANSADTSVAAQAMELQLEELAAAQAYTDIVAGDANAQVTQVTNSRNFQATVVDQAAAIPDTSGRYLKIVYAAVFALVLGVALIFAAEYLDQSVREPEEVEQLLGAPVIAVIPRVTPRTLRPASGTA